MEWTTLYDANADGMRQAVLLGVVGSKRAVYLEQAMMQMGVPLQVVDFNKWREDLPAHEIFLKIDPPQWESAALTDLIPLMKGYYEDLISLERRAKRYPMEFFNAPSTIRTLLDKRLCKQILKQKGLPVTETLGKGVGEDVVHTMEELLEWMREQAVCQVFIKPVCGSGASGVSAFRIQPSTGRMVLYTCTAWDEIGRLVNTKRLVRVSKRDEICQVLSALLEMDCIVERWYAKAEYQGYSYDLRAVVQDDRIDFLLARLSKGPITNLQLNNRPLAIEALHLSEDLTEKIVKLCREAMTCFPRLRSAGIDLLLERGSLRPRIIEMNAQGDLIYQDIYGQNQIYHHQAKMIREWIGQEEE